MAIKTNAVQTDDVTSVLFFRCDDACLLSYSGVVEDRRYHRQRRSYLRCGFVFSDDHDDNHDG